MRLRPSKGEGERSKSLIKKGPLIITTALLVGYPVCAAQAATSALGLSTQPQQKTQKSSQLQSQPRNYLSLRLIASLPSNQDLVDLQSTLDSYKSQLSILKASKPLDPDLDTQIAQEISNAESKIQLLTNKILKLKTDLAALQLAQNTLTSALQRLDSATTKEATAKSNLDTATATHTEASTQAALDAQAVLSAQATLEDSKSATLTAKDVATLSQAALENQAAVMTQAQQAVQQQQQASDEAQARVDAAQQTLNEATSALQQASTDLDRATVELQTKQSKVDSARLIYNQALDHYNQTLDTYTTVYNEYLAAQSAQNQAQTTLIQTQDTLIQAQWNYDNNLIPDPTWTPTTQEVAHTRQVPVTTLVPVTTTQLTGGLTADSFNRQNYGGKPPLPASNETPIATQVVPNINFQWSGGQVLNSGKSDRVLVRFTGNISFPDTQDVRFYAPGDDGVQLYIDGNLIINDWFDKGGGGSQSNYLHFEGGSSHTLTLYFYENGGGANVWLYYATPITGFQIVPAAYLGTTATTTTTYVEQTTYTTETYYTTEVVPGQVHPLINDPALLSALEEAQQNQQLALATFNEADQIWKAAQAAQQTAARDSLAGYYQVIDTATTLNSASSDLDVEQNTFNQVQSSYNQTLQTKQEAQQDLTNKKSTLNEESTKLQTKKNVLSTETRKSQAAQTSNEVAKQDLTAKQATQASAQDAYDQSVTKSLSSSSNEAAAKTNEDAAVANYVAAQDETSAATSNKTSAEQQLQESESAATTSNEEAQGASTIPFSQIKDLLNQEPPKKEEGSAEIPPVIEDLMKVDLAAVDPTELTPEQATQLVEAALVVFETATEGSAEYEQALDALYLAAEQDDIVIDAALAEIPGVGQAAVAIANVLNLVGNVGADISPKARKKAQTLVVTTLVIGQIAQTAALATASSGGSSNRTIRRK